MSLKEEVQLIDNVTCHLVDVLKSSDKRIIILFLLPDKTSLIQLMDLD